MKNVKVYFSFRCVYTKVTGNVISKKGTSILQSKIVDFCRINLNPNKLIRIMRALNCSFGIQNKWLP